jgi:hypothetical protein
MILGLRRLALALVGSRVRRSLTAYFINVVEIGSTDRGPLSTLSPNPGEGEVRGWLRQDNYAKRSQSSLLL